MRMTSNCQYFNSNKGFKQIKWNTKIPIYEKNKVHRMLCNALI